jgi:Biotin carboxylase
LKGHAIECRINAEDPARRFLPCPGTVHDLHFPGGNGVRIESALYNGYTIPAFYDSMVAKVIVHGEDREEAIRKMRSALGEVVVDGVTTNLDFQYEMLEHPVFLSGDINTHFIPDYFEEG